MGKINSEGFRQICDRVWRDRGAILFWRGPLSGEDALLRAVYWRLHKEGVEQDQSVGDRQRDPKLLTYQVVLKCMLTQSAQSPLECVSSLKELVRRYKDESGAELKKMEAESKA
ncbi:MAG: hypothetical protein WBP93_06575 [Pyrinomonadaceae bacterium]